MRVPAPWPLGASLVCPPAPVCRSAEPCPAPHERETRLQDPLGRASGHGLGAKGGSTQAGTDAAPSRSGPVPGLRGVSWPVHRGSPGGVGRPLLSGPVSLQVVQPDPEEAGRLPGAGEGAPLGGDCCEDAGEGLPSPLARPRRAPCCPGVGPPAPTPCARPTRRPCHLWVWTSDRVSGLLAARPAVAFSGPSGFQVLLPMGGGPRPRPCPAGVRGECRLPISPAPAHGLLRGWGVSCCGLPAEPQREPVRVLPGPPSSPTGGGPAPQVSAAGAPLAAGVVAWAGQGCCAGPQGCRPAAELGPERAGLRPDSLTGPLPPSPVSLFQAKV